MTQFLQGSQLKLICSYSVCIQHVGSNERVLIGFDLFRDFLYFFIQSHQHSIEAFIDLITILSIDLFREPLITIVNPLFKTTPCIFEVIQSFQYLVIDITHAINSLTVSLVCDTLLIQPTLEEIVHSENWWLAFTEQCIVRVLVNR